MKRIKNTQKNQGTKAKKGLGLIKMINGQIQLDIEDSE